MVDVRQAEQRKPDNTAEGHEDVRWLASIGRPIKVLRPYLNEDGGIAPNAAISSSISVCSGLRSRQSRTATNVISRATKRRFSSTLRRRFREFSRSPRRQAPVVPATRPGKVGCLENVKDTSLPSTCDRMHAHTHTHREGERGDPLTKWVMRLFDVFRLFCKRKTISEFVRG